MQKGYEKQRLKHEKYVIEQNKKYNQLSSKFAALKKQYMPGIKQENEESVQSIISTSTLQSNSEISDFDESEDEDHVHSGIEIQPNSYQSNAYQLNTLQFKSNQSISIISISYLSNSYHSNSCQFISI